MLVLTNEVEVEELPLKFEDIVDEKTYDKMRPPKPGGGLPYKVELWTNPRKENPY